MIKNFQEIKKVEVCIVGSGIGGSTLALKLAEKGIGFIIIEAGGLKNSSNNVTFENIGRKFGLRTTRSIQLGGTTNLWHGVLSPLDKIDFERRAWVANSGWPISLDDLEPFYKEAADIFNVKDYDFFNTFNLSNKLKEKISDMKFNRNFLKNKMFQQPLPVKNFKNDIIKLVKTSNKYHLSLNTTALELLKDTNGCITGLKCGTENGSIFEIKANDYIISTGALETPRLLLNSNINNKNIGRYLMDHPMSSLCQVQPMYKQKTHIYSAIKYTPTVVIKTGLELRDNIQKNLKLPNHAFYMRPSFAKGVNNGHRKIKLSLLTFKDGGVTFKDIWNVITSFNVIFQLLLYKFSLNTTYKYVDLFFVAEQTPTFNSKVSLSNKLDKWGYPISKVNWQVSTKDKKYMNQWYEIIKDKCGIHCGEV